MLTNICFARGTLIETPSGIAYIRPMPRIPTNYSGMFKPYGNNNAMNPLKWRFNSRFGQGVVPISGDKIGFPVQHIIGYTEFGFGFGRDRTNGVLLEIDSSGSYGTPTIS